MSGVVRRRVTVRGIVQGVGFRPAMYRHAVACGVTGLVGNDGLGVFVEVEGAGDAVAAFVEGLCDAAPVLAVVDEVSVEVAEPRGATRFVIVESDASTPAQTLLSPDLAPCSDCLAELADPADRRHRYPFLNCTNCGPRYSIVRRLPYDRATTTMADFVMCERCAAEYEDPLDRRFHAQPTCCADCGPALSLRDGSGRSVASDAPLSEAVDRLRRGEVVAVKGLGGYHLAVDAGDEDAVARLRARKHREDKPFALLVESVTAARRIARVDETEADLLTDPARPIVLLARADRGSIAPSVAPGSRSLGIMLPPTPLHVLLAADVARPLVLTSGNRSSEPIVTDDDEALDRLAGIADAYLVHDRPIQVRVDDSVTRVVGDRQIVMRRARGLAPRPVRVARRFRRHTLAVGAQLKSTVCLGRDDLAFVSQHLGDLENHATYESFVGSIDHLCHLFGVDPEVVAHDLHPDMTSTSHARAIDGVEHVEVQHHHAHIASCLADNEVDGPVIGVAFDGLGLGVDGSIWGGEILHADLLGFDRLGHLAAVPMPGGDAAVREPWRMAAVHVARCLDTHEIEALDVFSRHRERWAAITSMAASGLNAPLTSSAGRLFDAVASLVGLRDEVTYEGQAAIELEQAVDLDEAGRYGAALLDGEPFEIDTASIIRGVADDVAAGASVGTVAARFHNTVLELIADGAERARQSTGTVRVALSGGVFQNALLVERVTTRLAADGFEVVTHRQFPANDGGISLGQAVVAAARDRSGG